MKEPRMKPILIVLALLSAAPAVLRAATPSDLKKWLTGLSVG
jgi:hypothetical protein